MAGAYGNPTGGGGGGGANVTANPAGDATGTLLKLLIGSIVYKLSAAWADITGAPGKASVSDTITGTVDTEYVTPLGAEGAYGFAKDLAEDMYGPWRGVNEHDTIQGGIPANQGWADSNAEIAAIGDFITASDAGVPATGAVIYRSATWAGRPSDMTAGLDFQTTVGDAVARYFLCLDDDPTPSRHLFKRNGNAWTAIAWTDDTDGVRARHYTEPDGAEIRVLHTNWGHGINVPGLSYADGGLVLFSAGRPYYLVPQDVQTVDGIVWSRKDFSFARLDGQNVTAAFKAAVQGANETEVLSAFTRVVAGLASAGDDRYSYIVLGGHEQITFSVADDLDDVDSNDHRLSEAVKERAWVRIGTHWTGEIVSLDSRYLSQGRPQYNVFVKTRSGAVPAIGQVDVVQIIGEDVHRGQLAAVAFTGEPTDLEGVPDVPASNGTYKLRATRASGGVTWSWVDDS